MSVLKCMNRVVINFVVTVSSLLMLTNGANATIIISDSSISTFDIQSTAMSTFRGLLDTATGNDLVFAADLSNASQVASADALFIATRDGTATLSGAEITNILSFIATGKRVFLGGENTSFNTWNNSILSLVGASAGGDINGVQTTILAHALTAGVSTVDVPFGSIIAAGGTSLFDGAFANLWGASQNVLSVQDANMYQDLAGHIGREDNLAFATNIAAWLAASQAVSVPEPSTLGLLGGCLLGLGFIRRRRRAA